MGCRALYTVILIGFMHTVYSSISGVSAITYTLEKKGTVRLGDNLLRYAHALWVAYKQGIPLLYKPFEYSESLMLSTMHNTLHAQRFLKVVHLRSPKDVAYLQKDKQFLYVLPTFFSEIKGQIYKHDKIWSSFKINWNDQQFLAQLKAAIKPKVPLQMVSIPSGYVSVAIHVRHGGGFDHIYQKRNSSRKAQDRWSPLRFPPESYYIEQIKKIVDLVGSAPLYAHIFTDDPDPQALAQRFEEALKNPRVRFGFRAFGNHHAKNVLEDLFSMAQFDYMVRPESFFSFIASKLGSFKMVIKPTRYHWFGRRLIIDAVALERTI